MERSITWYNVANAYDNFIGWLLQKMYEEPKDWQFLRQELIIVMSNKQYYMLLAEWEHRYLLRSL